MPKYGMQSKYARRNDAIRRKGAVETEMLMDAVPVISAKPTDAPYSPISIASALDASWPEMKPLTLPGEWTVVGKGGRPLKKHMYSEPVVQKKKKKNRSRPRKIASQAPVHILMVEGPSSSKCFQDLDRSIAQHNKVVARSLEVKKWVRYRQAKAVKVSARDELIAALEGDCDSEIEPANEKRRNTKPNSNAAKARRRARFAASAARCLSLETEDDEMIYGRRDRVGASSPQSMRLALVKESAAAMGQEPPLDLELCRAAQASNQADKPCMNKTSPSKGKGHAKKGKRTSSPTSKQPARRSREQGASQCGMM